MSLISRWKRIKELWAGRNNTSSVEPKKLVQVWHIDITFDNKETLEFESWYENKYYDLRRWLSTSEPLMFYELEVQEASGKSNRKYKIAKNHICYYHFYSTMEDARDDDTEL
jgi:hypothetical protein